MGSCGDRPRWRSATGARALVQLSQQLDCRCAVMLCQLAPLSSSHLDEERRLGSPSRHAKWAVSCNIQVCCTFPFRGFCHAPVGCSHWFRTPGSDQQFLTKHAKISRANSWDLPIPYDPEWYEEHYPPPSDSDRSWEQREHFLATYGTHSRFLAGLFLQEIFYIGIERAQNHLRLREWQDEVWQQFNFCDLHISGEFMDR